MDRAAWLSLLPVSVNDALTATAVPSVNTAPPAGDVIVTAGAALVTVSMKVSRRPGRCRLMPRA